MKKFLEDFKKFALRGNVIDLAVGVIIGGAFGKIVTSLVNDIIMPLISLIVGGVDLSSLEIMLASPIEGVAPAAFKYGAFLQSALDFLIIAFFIFLFVRLFAKLQKKKEEAPAAPAGPTATEVLLTEIRDLLKDKEGEKKEEKAENAPANN